MAANLSIDRALIELAMEVSGERTKKAAVTKALQEFIARRRHKRLLDMMGKHSPRERERSKRARRLTPA
jgi:hypothetical protein